MSENSLAARGEITVAKIMEYLDSAGITAKLLDHEKKMFFNIAREFGLNPFKREIHIAAYGEGENRKLAIVTGYEVYLKRAENSGKLDGWNARIEGEGKDLKAVVEIYRKDQSHPFVHEAHYAECCQYNRDGRPNALWAKMPRFMTKKTAIGQAFRLCFPVELGGMPYEESELPQQEERAVAGEENVTAETERIGRKIGDILRSLDEDGLLFFTDEETRDERLKFAAASGINELRGQLARLRKELAERQKNRQPVPFGEEGGEQGGREN